MSALGTNGGGSLAARRHEAQGEVALVLPGGGARGAYEVGALTVLLPALEARGERVSVFCGTSVGAINAAALASVAHLPVHGQVATLLERWSRVQRGTVLRRIIGPRSPLRLARLAGEIAGLPGVRAGGLLEPALESSLDGWIDWDALHDNVEAGHARGVCVLATALRTAPRSASSSATGASRWSAARRRSATSTPPSTASTSGRRRRSRSCSPPWR